MALRNRPHSDPRSLSCCLQVRDCLECNVQPVKWLPRTPDPNPRTNCCPATTLPQVPKEPIGCPPADSLFLLSERRDQPAGTLCLLATLPARRTSRLLNRNDNATTGYLCAQLLVPSARLSFGAVLDFLSGASGLARIVQQRMPYKPSRSVVTGRDLFAEMSAQRFRPGHERLCQCTVLWRWSPSQPVPQFPA